MKQTSYFCVHCFLKYGNISKTFKITPNFQIINQHFQIVPNSSKKVSFSQVVLIVYGCLKEALIQIIFSCDSQFAKLLMLGCLVSIFINTAQYTFRPHAHHIENILIEKKEYQSEHFDH